MGYVVPGGRVVVIWDSAQPPPTSSLRFISAVAAHLWNNRLPKICPAPSLGTFQGSLQTWLLGQAFPEIAWPEGHVPPLVSFGSALWPLHLTVFMFALLLLLLSVTLCCHLCFRFWLFV